MPRGGAGREEAHILPSVRMPCPVERATAQPAPVHPNIVRLAAAGGWSPDGPHERRQTSKITMNGGKGAANPAQSAASSHHPFRDGDADPKGRGAEEHEATNPDRRGDRE